MPVSFSIADSSEGPRRIVIWVTGELDSDTATAVRARLSQAERQGRSNVILDLTGVSFVDSAGVNAIIAGARELHGKGRLSVISPPESVAELLTDAGSDDLFDIITNRRDKPDRRKQSVPVEVDRRKVDRRHPPVANGV
jgi:anti-sigma B factor antagonist